MLTRMTKYTTLLFIDQPSFPINFILRRFYVYKLNYFFFFNEVIKNWKSKTITTTFPVNILFETFVFLCCVWRQPSEGNLHSDGSCKIYIFFFFFNNNRDWWKVGLTSVDVFCSLPNSYPPSLRIQSIDLHRFDANISRSGLALDKTNEKVRSLEIPSYNVLLEKTINLRKVPERLQPKKEEPKLPEITKELWVGIEPQRFCSKRVSSQLPE